MWIFPVTFISGRYIKVCVCNFYTVDSQLPDYPSPQLSELHNVKPTINIFGVI